MTTEQAAHVEELRAAIRSMADALKEHYEYGPFYEPVELADIENRLTAKIRELEALEVAA